MDHMQEFAHDGDHDDAPALAARLEFTGPLREIRVVAQHGEGAHVEPLAHLSIACHRDGGFAMHRSAREALCWTQAGIGHQLGSATEAVLVKVDGVEPHGCQAGNAWDRVKAVTRMLEVRVLLHMRDGALQGAFPLLLQPADMGCDLLADLDIQAQVLATIALLLHGELQIVEPSQQALQVLDLERRRAPECWTFLLTEARQQQRIVTIRFGADAFTEAKGGHARRIDDTDLVTVLKEEGSDGIRVGASCFQTGVDAAGALAFQPLCQQALSIWAIGKTPGRCRPVLAEQARIQRQFGHIDAQRRKGVVHQKELLDMVH